MNPPPKTLDELLDDFSAPATDNLDLDTAIGDHIWAKRFRDYLRKRDLEDEEIALKFLIATQPLKVKRDQVLRLNNNSKRHRALRKDMDTSVRRVTAQFFDEDSETVVCLADKKCFRVLCEKSAQFKKLENGEVTDTDIEWLLRARDDLDVWQNGVEQTFMNFLAVSGRASHPLAVLLSIL